MLNAADAQKFCTDQGKRLATPDEWAYAASGGDRKLGSSTKDGALSRKGVVYCDSIIGGGCLEATADVGSLKGNYVSWSGQEVWDLNGNVWEWTYDPATKEFSISGGSWKFNYPMYLAAGGRLVDDPGNRSDGLGVRCVSDT